MICLYSLYLVFCDAYLGAEENSCVAGNAKPLRPRFHGELRAVQTVSVTIIKIRVLADTLTPLIQSEYLH